MSIKPTETIGFATNQVNESVSIGGNPTLVTNKVEPTQELKDSGVLAREKWARPYLNWLLDYFSRWIRHFNTNGIANYDAITDYDVSGLAKGSDGNIYEVAIANGPASTVVNPVGDITGTWRLAYVGAGRGAELTIAGGIISVIKGLHYVDTEADAATDDLNTINGGIDGMVIRLQAANSARTVVVKHNIGNIQLAGLTDFSLDNQFDVITLMWDEALSVWLEISRSNNGV